MKISKQLFEDVLSGKLKGTFVLRNGRKVKSSKLSIDTNTNTYYPISLNGNWYTNQGELNLTRNSNIDIIDFIPDTIEIDPEMYSYNAKDIQFIEHFINSYHMKENELTIEIPEGKIVDWDESKKQNKIVFKNKQLTYEDICDRLPGMIDVSLFDIPSEDGNALVADEHQLECLLAKNKLANVCKFLNGDIDYSTIESCWGFDVVNKRVAVACYRPQEPTYQPQFVCKSKKLAQQAIEILGEETVKLALEPLGI